MERKRENVCYDTWNRRAVKRHVFFFHLLFIHLGQMKSISETLRDHITASQESYHTIAEAIGISDGILSRFMREERSMNLATAEKLAEYFGLELRPVRKKS